MTNRKRLTICIAAISLLTLATVIAWRLSPLATALQPANATKYFGRIQHSAWAPYIFIGIYPLAGLILFPVMLLSGIVAYLFSPLQAMVVMFSGFLLSAALLHWIGAHFAQHVRELLGAKMQRVDALMADQGIITIATIRMLPIAPFTVVNLIAGALGVQFRDYMVGTALGMAPGTIMLCLFGQQAKQLWQHPTPVRIAAALASLLTWVLLSWLLQRWARRHRAGQ